MDNARSGLGTCVLTVRNFLRGQVCSLTAVEDAVLKLLRFISLKNTGEKKSSDNALLFTVYLYSLRRVAPQRRPVWLQI